MCDAGNEILLAAPPRRLGDLVSVSAAVDDLGHAVPEAPANLIEQRPPALVLDSVVQQRGDRLVFVASRLQHQRANRQQMSDIRSTAAFARLVAMQRRRPNERLLKALSHNRGQLRRGHWVSINQRRIWDSVS